MEKKVEVLKKALNNAGFPFLFSQTRKRKGRQFLVFFFMQ